jgi:HEAT repeat protein
MQGRHCRLPAWALSLVICVSGCQATASGAKGLLTRAFKKTPEQKLGIKTPADRVDDLRRLAKRAKKLPAAEQERLVGELVAEFPRESDGWVRREMLRTLAQFPQPAAGALLVSALADADVQTRRVACAGLGTRGDQIAVQELSRVLASDTNVDVRLAAIEALGTAGDKGALVPLSEAMVDPDPAVQVQAQRALVAVSGRDYGPNVQAWREFAQKGGTEAAEVSFAEKLRRSFY